METMERKMNEILGEIKKIFFFFAGFSFSIFSPTFLNWHRNINKILYAYVAVLSRAWFTYHREREIKNINGELGWKCCNLPLNYLYFANVVALFQLNIPFYLFFKIINLKMHTCVCMCLYVHYYNMYIWYVILRDIWM